MSDDISRMREHPVTLLAYYAAEELDDPQPLDVIAFALARHGRGDDDGSAADILPGAGLSRETRNQAASLILSCIFTVFGDDLKDLAHPPVVRAVEFTEERVGRLIGLLQEQLGDAPQEQREEVRAAIMSAVQRVERSRSDEDEG